MPFYQSRGKRSGIKDSSFATISRKLTPPGPIKFSRNNERQKRALLCRAEATAQMTTIKENRSHLGVNQPAVVERDVEQIEHDAFWGVLEDSHAGELHIHVQTCLQLVQHCHGVAHVLV